jgi:hypothetical protein
MTTTNDGGIHPMVMKAARSLCAQEDAVDPEFYWQHFGHKFIARAQAALTDCGALECLEAAKGLHRKLYEVAERHNDRSCDYDVCPEIRAYESAIAKARDLSSAGKATAVEVYGSATE